MSNRRFIVVEFSDGIQVIPKTWLQNKEWCKYPVQYKSDSRIRKVVEKEETPTSSWPSFKIEQIFASLEKANAKAEKALYTSDMDTEKKTKHYRKYRARKLVFSPESEAP